MRDDFGREEIEMNKPVTTLAWLLMLAVLTAPRAAKAGDTPTPESSAPLSSAVGNAAAMPWCSFLATRKTLNDLIYIDQVLANEVSYLLADTTRIYDSWRSFGEGYSRSERYQSPKGVIERSVKEDQRTDIWNLYTNVRTLSETMSAVSKDAQSLEKEWWGIRSAMKKELDRGGTGEKSAPRLDKLRQGLNSLSARYNAVNPQIPRLQYQLDYIRSNYLQYINRLSAAENNTSAAVDLPDPWHWVYRNSQTPRAMTEYDFDTSYGKYLELSHSELHTGRQAAADGRK